MSEVVRSPGHLLDQHLDEMTLMLYVEGQLDRKRAQEVSAHTQDCASCRTLLRALERESRLLTRAMLEEDEPLPSRLAAFQERARNSMQWIWGAVLGLAATGAYAFYTGYVEPMQNRFEQAGLGGSNLFNLMIFQGAFWKGWQSMLTLLEVLALLVIAASAMMFIRRRIRRGSAFAMIAGIFAATSLSPAMPAQEFRHSDTVNVEKSEVVKGDAFFSGAHVKVEGTVDGDLYVFAQEANIQGHVTGDVIAFVQILRLNGQVDGNVRSFTNTVLISGNVSKNITSFAESVTLDSSGKVGGSITTFANTLTVDGHVGRTVLALLNAGNFSGTVGGGIHAQGSSLNFNNGAQIDGPVTFKGEHSPNIASGAKLEVPVQFTQVEHHESYRDGGFYVWRVIWTAAVVLFGLVLFLVLPAFARESVDSAQRYGASFGLGALVLFAVPIAALIACITVVGIPIGVSTFVLWMAALNSAGIVVGAIVGQWLMGYTRETWQLIGRMVVGVILLRVVEMIPHLGGWVKFAVVVWGLGAISLALYHRFAPAPRASSPAAPTIPQSPQPPQPLPPNTTIVNPQPI